MPEASQKFHRGDLVHIARDLGASMSHFTGDIDAIVDGSYADVCTPHYHGDFYHLTIYSLILLPKDEKPYTVAWYHENQLTLVKKRKLIDVQRVEQFHRDRGK